MFKGSIIKHNNKNYEVIGLWQDKEAKLLRTDIRMLEIGKKRMSKISGMGINKGKILDVDNSIFRTWYAQAIYTNNFEIIS